MKSKAKKRRASARRKKRLYVFDFDDTLVKTDAVIRVFRRGNVHKTLTPAQFAVYERAHDEKFDFSEFCRLINPKPIMHVCSIFHGLIDEHGVNAVIILSARSSVRPIRRFLRSIDRLNVEAIALDDADPTAKASWLSIRMTMHDIDHLEFWDDSPKNIKAIRSLRKRHKKTTIKVHHVRA